LKPSEQKRFEERLRLFVKEPYSPVLRNHALKGPYKDYYSINITGDLRALSQLVTNDIALFIIINTHSNLYS
jgi:mRNA-degrading endonuclease YafQ of YafQ-DinJ toxin-antitoxin module